ncbi:MAG: AAA family ATPase, partial [Syntrophales bacterium]
MYAAYFGLKENPFNLTPDPRYFFFSRRHREALNHLLYGIKERKGFIVLTGGVGTGKTTVCRALLANLDKSVDSALIFNSFVS